MNMLVVFILIAVFSAAVFFFFNYIEQPLLGIILVVIMFCWPIIFWFISKLTDSYGSKEEGIRRERSIPEAVEKERNKKAPENIVKEAEPNVEEKEKPDQKTLNTEMKADIEALKKVSVLLDEERKDGILSEETYNELKRQNEYEMNKLKAEIRIDEEISKS